MLDMYNDYVHNNVKLRDHWNITEKYRGSAQRDSVILKSNPKSYLTF